MYDYSIITIMVRNLGVTFNYLPTSLPAFLPIYLFFHHRPLDMFLHPTYASLLQVFNLPFHAQVYRGHSRTISVVRSMSHDSTTRVRTRVGT